MLKGAKMINFLIFMGLSSIRQKIRGQSANFENISHACYEESCYTIVLQPKPLQFSSGFKIQTSIRIKSQPNIKTLNLSNKITGLQSSKQATKDSHRNAILLAVHGTGIKIGGEQNESKTATFLHTLEGMDVTTPPPPKAYQRVRRTACPTLARTHSLVSHAYIHRP